MPQISGCLRQIPVPMLVSLGVLAVQGCSHFLPVSGICVSYLSLLGLKE